MPVTVTEMTANNWGNCPFPFVFFPDNAEEERPEKALCKVYNDGGHYVAIPYFEGESKRKPRENRERTALQEQFDSLYAYALAESFDEEQRREFLSDNLCHLFDDEKHLDEFITEQEERKARNIYEKKKRFRRKAYLNRWNYFITLTYDDEKHTEEQFRRKLRRCLCNLHTRRGWKYMGVFERAPETGRLHFHALLFVPHGEMLGKITEKEDYSTKQHKMQITHENSFFAKRFGRNDFCEVDFNGIKYGNAVDYCLKYIEKTGERLTYSRGVPTEIYKEIEQKDMICKMRDYVLKFVLFDDVIDWETDVLNRRPPETLFDISPHWLN